LGLVEKERLRPHRKRQGRAIAVASAAEAALVDWAVGAAVAADHAAVAVLAAAVPAVAEAVEEVKRQNDMA